MIVETEFLRGTGSYQYYFKTTMTASEMAEAFISGEPVRVHLDHQDGFTAADGETYLDMIGYEPEYEYTQGQYHFHYDQSFIFTNKGINLYNTDSYSGTELDNSLSIIDGDGYIRFFLHVE